MSDYLLPRAEDNGNQDAGNIEPVRRDRLHNARLGGPQQNDLPLVPRIAADDQGRDDIVGNAVAAEESDADDHTDSE